MRLRVVVNTTHFGTTAFSNHDYVIQEVLLVTSFKLSIVEIFNCESLTSQIDQSVRLRRCLQCLHLPPSTAEKPRPSVLQALSSHEVDLSSVHGPDVQGRRPNSSPPLRVGVREAYAGW